MACNGDDDKGDRVLLLSVSPCRGVVVDKLEAPEEGPIILAGAPNKGDRVMSWTMAEPDKACGVPPPSEVGGVKGFQSDCKGVSLLLLLLLLLSSSFLDVGGEAI